MTATDARNDVTSSTMGVYLQDQIVLSKRWSVLAGVRYDSFKVNFDDLRTLGTPVDLARTDNAFSPRLGFLWSPNPAATYYMSYSTAVLPSGEQLSLAPTTSDLAPERANNFEIGARWDLRRRLTLSTALFRTDRVDVKVADPANPGFFVKSGAQRTEGIELGLQGDITPTWSVYAGYSYLNGYVLKPITSGTTATAASVTPAGNRIGLVPMHALAVWNRYDRGVGLGAGLGVIYQSSYFTSFNNTVKVPGFGRLDGALYYTLANGKTRVALNVENLLDKWYFPTVDGDNNISPGAPRSIRITVSTPF
jgi:catecholate siderophore receptor